MERKAGSTRSGLNNARGVKFLYLDFSYIFPANSNEANVACGHIGRGLRSVGLRCGCITSIRACFSIFVCIGLWLQG